MKIYITGLPSGYEVEHLVRLFTHGPAHPDPARSGRGLRLGREKAGRPVGHGAAGRQNAPNAHAPLPAPVEQGGETPEFSLASLTYDLLRQWTGIRPPWGKMTGVRPVRLIHDKRAAGWTRSGDRPLLPGALRLLGAEIPDGQGHRRPAGADFEGGQ